MFVEMSCEDKKSRTVIRKDIEIFKWYNLYTIDGDLKLPLNAINWENKTASRIKLTLHRM